MAYTYGGNKPKNVPPDLASNFSNLQMDGARNALTGVLGNRMQSVDASDTPNYSPLSNAADTGITLKVPKNAAQFVINSSVTCQVGEDSSYAYGFTVPADTSQTFDVANQQYIYLKPSSGTNTIQFYFSLI